jgi:hypothetical protein
MRFDCRRMHRQRLRRGLSSRGLSATAADRSGDAVQRELSQCAYDSYPIHRLIGSIIEARTPPSAGRRNSRVTSV